MHKPRILIADDEKDICDNIQDILEDQGYEIDLALDGDEAWHKFRRDRYDLVITDLKMPGKSGMELLGLIKKENPDVPVIVITAYGSIGSAVQAMKAGAYDYIPKPFEKEEIPIIVSKALAFSDLKYENRYLRKAVKARYNFDDLVGSSQKIKELRDLAARVAQEQDASTAPPTVLVQGECGTGKELLVKLIHFNSSRASRPFVAFNCGALPDNLVESELFGVIANYPGFHNKEPLKGKFELAHNGTIFLDEVGDLSHAAQTKILRVLEEKELTPLGGKNPVKVDVWIIAATNRDLKEMVEKGSFRKDLYYRLDVVLIHIPPLREHIEDLDPLVKHILKHFSQKMGKEKKEVSKEAMDLLCSHSWPGNVRELRNVLERAMILCKGKIITPKDLLISHIQHDPEPTTININIPPEGISLEEVIKSYIKGALNMTKGNQAKAARLLKINRNTLRFRMEKYKINPNA